MKRTPKPDPKRGQRWAYKPTNAIRPRDATVESVSLFVVTLRAEGYDKPIVVSVKTLHHEWVLVEEAPCSP